MNKAYGWGIEIHSGRDGKTLRVYHVGDGGFADKDIEVRATVLPELYDWLEARLAVKQQGAQG